MLFRTAGFQPLMIMSRLEAGGPEDNERTWRSALRQEVSDIP